MIYITFIIQDFHVSRGHYCDTEPVDKPDDKFSLLARVRNLFPCWQSWSTVSSVRIMKLLHVQLCLTIFTFVASLPQVRAM